MDRRWWLSQEEALACGGPALGCHRQGSNERTAQGAAQKERTGVLEAKSGRVLKRLAASQGLLFVFPRDACGRAVHPGRRDIRAPGHANMSLDLKVLQRCGEQ